MSYETITNLNMRQSGSFKTTRQVGKDKFVQNHSFSSILDILIEYFGPFSTLICDEGHRLKTGPSTQLYKLLNRIQAKQRIVLTETPVQDSFDELMNLL